ncbi:hypothetical protein RyT2_18210 [Pseudolactococcus yaeyamensis]
MKNILKQKKLLTVLGVFMALMLGFTYLSKATHRLTIPEVTVTQLTSGELTENFMSTGTIGKLKMIPIFVEEGQKTTAISVQVGQVVEVGTPLMTVDLTTLNQQVAKLEQEINTQNLLIAANVQQVQSSQSTKVLRITQAQETYATVVAQQETTVMNAQNELSQAQADYANAKENRDGLKVIVSEKEKNLKIAQDMRDSGILQAKQAIELARAEPDLPTSDSGIAYLTVMQLTQELQKLKTLQTEKGVIKSTSVGIVSSITVTVGSSTTPDAAFILADSDSENTLTFQIDKSQQNMITVGEIGEVTGVGNKGSRKFQDEATVLSVTTLTDNPQFLQVRVGLGKVAFAYDSFASFTLNKTSITYEACLPTEALHEDSKGFYVLICDEKENISGKDNIAKKVRVEVLEQTAMLTAIAPNTGLDKANIICEINKTIFEGDKVRVVENATTTDK